MQVSFDRYSAGESAEIFGKFSEDFRAKMVLNVIDNNDFLDEKPQNQEEDEEVHDHDNENDDDDDDDFSFVCTNPNGSPISADDIFQNGQIRPIFPLFNRDLLLADYDGDLKPKNMKNSLRPPLKKLFVEEDDSSTAPDPTGPFCEWTGKTVQDASPESCKKSNSTGFSKLFRIRELVLRSNSDGKDAFVLFNHHGNEKSEKKIDKVKKVKPKEDTATLSAYMKNRNKDNDKRKPYLPYKQVGFFTNVNGLSRNIHPF